MVCHSFTSPWKSAWIVSWSLVRLMLLWHVSPCLYVGRLDILVCSWKVHLRPFVCPWAHLACFLVHPSVNTYFVQKHISSHASFICPLVNLSFCMCSLCLSHSWSPIFVGVHVHQIKNLVVYHDTWSFQMQVIERGSNVVRPDESLCDEDGKSKSIMTVYSLALLEVNFRRDSPSYRKAMQR